MSSIFRSEHMSLCQIFLTAESSYNCIAELGEIGVVEFRDQNAHVNSFQRKFVHEIRRCDEMERKLRFLERELAKDGIEIENHRDNPDAPQPREMVDLEATFEKLEQELLEVKRNSEEMVMNNLQLLELLHVLQASQTFFEEQESEGNSVTQNLISEAEKQEAHLGFIAGMISRKRMATFERMLWRVCRGNAFLRQYDIDEPVQDPKTGDYVFKVAFMVFFQGEQLKNKVTKICEGCKSTIYPCPESQNERSDTLKKITNSIEEVSGVLEQTYDHRRRVLVSASKQLRSWFIKVRKLKGIYHVLNMLNYDVTNQMHIVEAWIPVNDTDTIKLALQRGVERSGSTVLPYMNSVETKIMPPTFYRCNKFTKAYQTLINSYRIGTYREINPGLFTVATFPFLFAVMFGDLGHGILMAAFALWMVLKEKALAAKNIRNEIWNMFFKGRYIILMMGLFSMYTGVIYNDIFSKSFNIFKSNWHVSNKTAQHMLHEHEGEVTLDPASPQEYEGIPYPVGMDPIWALSLNKINFWNSYKMKISVIIGITHMFSGVLLSLLNHIYYKRTLNIIFEFIPQVIFLLGLFGYLCFMIFFKWVVFGPGAANGFDREHNSECAPSILILFIDMMLLKTEEKTHEYCDPYLYNNQDIVQKVLVIVSVLCIPIMLFPKPFIIRSRHLKKMRISLEATSRSALTETAASGQATIDMKEDDTTEFETDNTPARHEEEKKFDFGDIFIHQAIHTIEYVLGSVSHTASYLRLWALSLAHGQLSEVLWMMVMKIGLTSGSYVGIILLYFIFSVWAFLTVAILVLMEGLSAFLHTLRLHWVEFCSKFYEGEGYLFVPFNFKHVADYDDPDQQ